LCFNLHLSKDFVKKQFQKNMYLNGIEITEVFPKKIADIVSLYVIALTHGSLK